MKGCDMHHPDVTIIGGGVNGMATALTLQLLGFDTVCYAEHLVNREAPSDPRFASLYPAASVIPHSVSTRRMYELFRPSQQVFDFLYKQKVPAMQLHRHYEVHEFPVDDPPYADYLDAYERIDHSEDPFIPRYSPGIPLSGWMFNCLVAEWPVYMDQLYQWYREAGGTIVQQKVNREDIKSLKSEIVINCTGIWGVELFDETEPPAIERGHLLFVEDAPLIRHPDGPIISYNYTPETDVYCSPNGSPSDVYFYPRSNGWIVGGSRQAGTVNGQNGFAGKEHTESLTVDGLSIPKAILKLNRKIVSHTYDRNMAYFSPASARVGYRFIKDLDKEGLRMETSHKSGKTIIHNYGHGGAGVTLSWGCALEVGKMVGDTGSAALGTAQSYSSDILHNLQKLLRDLATSKTDRK